MNDTETNPKNDENIELDFGFTNKRLNIKLCNNKRDESKELHLPKIFLLNSRLANNTSKLKTHIKRISIPRIIPERYELRRIFYFCM